MTQHFGQFLTNLSSAQSLKSLPIRGFCLYDVGQSLRLAPENRMLLPIRATEPRKVNIVRISSACVTISPNPYQGLKHGISSDFITNLRVTISTNPYQRLKLAIDADGGFNFRVTISTNPYQGLKLLS